MENRVNKLLFGLNEEVKGYYLISFAFLIFILTFYFVSAAADTQQNILYINETEINFLNILINNTNSEFNITSVNITLPDSFSYELESINSSIYNKSIAYIDLQTIYFINESEGIIISNSSAEFWFNFSAENPGNYNITLIIVYQNGFVNRSNLSVNVDDITPPEISLYNTNGNYSINTASFNISSNENLSVCVFSLDNFSTNYTMQLNSSLTGANYTLSSISDGNYIANYYCNDSFGNVNNSETFSFIVDTIYPIFYNYSDNNATMNGSGIATFFVNINQTNGTVILSINNTNYTAQNITSNIYNVSVFLVNGTYSYNWISYGNASINNLNISNTYFFTLNNSILDTIAPLVIIDSPQNITYISSSILFNLTLNETGFCNYSLDNGLNNYSLSSLDGLHFNASNLSIGNGNYTFFAYCTDLFGNLNHTSNISFNVYFDDSNDSQEVIPTRSSSGGGGGGGSNLYQVTGKELVNGYQKKLSKNSGYKFKLNDESHTIKILEINATEIKIEINSKTIIATLKLSENKKFDLNSDGKYDLLLQFSSFEKNTASVYLKEIYEYSVIDSLNLTEKLGNNSINNLNNTNINDSRDVSVKQRGKVYSIFIGVLISLAILFVSIGTVILIIRLTKSKFI